MKTSQKKLWRLIAAAGFSISLINVVISIVQYYYMENNIGIFARTVGLIINLMSTLFFSYLILNPFMFKIFAINFYIYGIGNFLDKGNLLGFICIVCSYYFFYADNFFREHKSFKISVFLILPTASLFQQFFTVSPLAFFVSTMHVIGGSLIFIIISLLYKMISQNELNEKKNIFLDSKTFTNQDLVFLEKVLAGTKYRDIAQLYEISESKVKNRMIEIYRILNVKDKTEFVTKFCNSKFQLR